MEAIWDALWISLVVCVAIFVPLIFVVALWEKHSVRAFNPPSQDEQPQLGPYLSAVDNEAWNLGLVKRSVARHTRYDLVGVSWFSRERDILEHSGQGKIAKLPVKQTWVYSRLSDGQILVTT